MVKKDVQPDAIDTVEYALALAIANDPNFKFENCPLEHTFTPGLYSRKIFMRKGLEIVSEVHKTEHQFVILDGVVSVYTEDTGWKILAAPYHGVTKSGTRRILKVEMDCIWITFHSTTLTNIDEIHNTIIEKRVNPLLNGKFQNNKFIHKQEILK